MSLRWDRRPFELNEVVVSKASRTSRRTEVVKQLVDRRQYSLRRWLSVNRCRMYMWNILKVDIINKRSIFGTVNYQLSIDTFLNRNTYFECIKSVEKRPHQAGQFLFSYHKIYRRADIGLFSWLNKSKELTLIFV